MAKLSTKIACEMAKSAWENAGAPNPKKKVSSAKSKRRK